MSSHQARKLSEERQGQRGKRDGLANGSGGFGVGEAGSSRNEALNYVIAMLKPLRDLSNAHEIGLLSYLLEMALLEAADQEMKCKPKGRRQVSISTPGSGLAR